MGSGGERSVSLATLSYDMHILQLELLHENKLPDVGSLDQEQGKFLKLSIHLLAVHQPRSG